MRTTAQPLHRDEVPPMSTDTPSPERVTLTDEQRATIAAIEADVLRRVPVRYSPPWSVYGDDWLRAEADRIEGGAR